MSVVEFEEKIAAFVAELAAARGRFAAKEAQVVHLVQQAEGLAHRVAELEPQLAMATSQLADCVGKALTPGLVDRLDQLLADVKALGS